MKERIFLTTLMFLGYFGTIITACILTRSSWPLLIMLFVTPSVKIDNDKEEKKSD